MIFLGDIASPYKSTTEDLAGVFSRNKTIFEGKRLVCNMEGLIADELREFVNEPVLWNHSSILSLFNKEPKPIICLANNHTLDLPGQFNSTIRHLKSLNIQYCGAGNSKSESEEILTFYDDDIPIAVFNVCWNFLLYNHENPKLNVFVAELYEAELIKKIIRFKNHSPHTYVVVFIHWSFDLEILPFPMSRKLSRDLIDAGANIVIGAHPHCIQGGEYHNNGYIIYSLGNFYIPHNCFINGKLIYPEFASLELAFEWIPSSNEALCHWFKYSEDNDNHNLEHVITERFSESTLIKKYTPYSNMCDKEYIRYYKKHRRKRIFVPVFKNYNNVIQNRILMAALKRRARLARWLAKMGLRGWLN